MIIMNDFSAYGKNSEDVTRHLNRSLLTDEEIVVEKVQGRYFKEIKCIGKGAKKAWTQSNQK